ncbi:Protein N-acetyltransferase, RimJ/RimL family [Paramicrobacterium humi]|uniref:Protein N-acetyltransferase, RimJ/RimL family n=1 Tax=Paramicrobacterium humi TaxID=640635 RepID=A0A1H4JXK9_9MICO|nr:GNAT family N-acetyltransferase [Microbacterium humi]SEB51041.1 Protein N-acetyltransferase, RimJ/RimL family [Microbacterium humi]
MIKVLYSDDGVVMLRPLTMADADAHLAGQDVEYVTWLDGADGTEATEKRRLADAEKAWEAGGPTFAFAIMSEGKLAGTITAEVGREDLHDNQADIVYGLYPDTRGRGIATRAVMLMVSFLDQVPGISEAVIRVSPANPRSRSVAERAGFEPLETEQTAGSEYEWLSSRVSLVPAEARG